MGLVDKDKGWKRIRRDLKTMRGGAVRVGYQSDDPAREGGLSMAQVAFWNEFGTARAPERSFMRSSFDEKQQSYLKLGQRLIGGIIDGRFTIWQMFSLLGQQVQSDVQRKINSNVPPPNAPSTIKRKKSSKTLIDTAAMMQAVRYVVDGRK